MRTILWLSPLLLVSCSQAPQSRLSQLSPERESAILGTYAQKLVFANVTEFPIVGKSHTVATTTGIAELRKVGDSYQLTSRSCHLQMVSDGILKISIADKNIQAVAPKEFAATVKEDEQGLAITRSTQADTIGVNLVSLDEELPVKDNDPRIFDADKDGKPGLTASAEAGPLKGQLYIIQRSINSFEAREGQAGTFSGLIQHRTEQSVVGTSSFLLNAAKGKFNMTQDSDPALSHAQLIKASDGINCADLDSIFAD